MARRETIVVEDVADLRLVSNAEDQDIAFDRDTGHVYDFDGSLLDVDDGDLVVKPTVLLAGQPGRWTRRSAADGSVPVAALAASVGSLRDPGRRAVNVLRVASDVVSATKVTIGADVYEIEIVNTDSTDDTANGDFDSVDSPLVVVDAVTGYPGCTFEVGALIRIESEILRVSEVDGDDVTFMRAQSGTSVAAHADANDVFVGDGIEVTSTIAVGLVTTLTPTAFTPALVADINEHAVEAVGATEITVNELLLTADAVGAVVLGCTETLGGANNAWAAVAMYGGAAPSTKKLVAQSRAPNAAEVALGNMHFAFDFAPTVVSLWVRVAATGLVVAWGGTFAITGNVLTLTNDTNPDWAATDLVTVVVIG